MGASNWAICPQCKQNAEKAMSDALAELSKMYGVVPLEEYEAAQKNVPSGKVEEPTLREDYEQGISEDGMYFLYYSGNCVECGLSHQEKIEKNVLKKVKLRALPERKRIVK